MKYAQNSRIFCLTPNNQPNNLPELMQKAEEGRAGTSTAPHRGAPSTATGWGDTPKWRPCGWWARRWRSPAASADIWCRAQSVKKSNPIHMAKKNNFLPRGRSKCTAQRCRFWRGRGSSSSDSRASRRIGRRPPPPPPRHRRRPKEKCPRTPPWPTLPENKCIISETKDIIETYLTIYCLLSKGFEWLWIENCEFHYRVNIFFLEFFRLFSGGQPKISLNFVGINHSFS